MSVDFPVSDCARSSSLWVLHFKRIVWLSREMLRLGMDIVLPYVIDFAYVTNLGSR